MSNLDKEVQAIEQAAKNDLQKVENVPLIFTQIPKALAEIGAIGKSKRNQQQGFMYRGVDDVYNAVNPVLAKFGLFMTAEVLEQTREERETAKGARLIYVVLKMRYRIYAADGSFVQTEVIGEGMDSGDKASNKAMSIAYKYALFQLLCIPTETVDPDAEVHPDVLPKGKTSAPRTPAGAPASAPRNAAPAAQVTQQATLPAQAQQETAEDAARKAQFVKDGVARINTLLGNPEGFQQFRTALINRGELTAKPAAQMTMEELTAMFSKIEAEGRRLGMIKDGDAA